MKVSYAAIKVRNMEESVRFYIDVLGLRETRRFSPHEGMNVVFLQGEGEGMIELIEGVEKSGWQIDSGAALLLVGMEVSDMDATVSDLQGKGVSFTQGPVEVHGGTKIGFLKDPDGVEIELVQHGRHNL